MVRFRVSLFSDDSSIVGLLASVFLETFGDLLLGECDDFFLLKIFEGDM
jgi:hypothetical protein